MKLIDTLVVDCTIADLIKLKGLCPGMVIHCENGYSILVGDCSKHIRPTCNDGGIGWIFNEDYGTLKVSRVDIYSIPSMNTDERDCEPPDFRDLMDLRKQKVVESC